MAKYVLRATNENGVVVLGSSLKAIKSKLKKHWDMELEQPELFNKKYIKKINSFLDKNHLSIEKMMDDYNKSLSWNTEYIFEEAD